ncbi:MAG: exonuclease domain-containing protein [Alphaproteobacteria bacterium]|nr:exonuclease domain-containing protein [Alphaproteobacteria bacterium]
MGADIVFYDTEYTSWEGAHENNWGEPWQKKELVQIGAIRFDLEELKERETFSILVKPEINPVLSDYFINLTHITNEDVEEHGVTFGVAYKKFLSFVKGLPLAAYGTDDEIIRENMALHGMLKTPDDFRSFNINPWFQEHGAAHGITRTTTSGALASALGLSLGDDHHVHNALDDVHSICAAYTFLRKKDAPPPPHI